MYRTLCQALINRFAIQTPPNRACDLGCGTGESTRVLQSALPANVEVVGTDGSLAMLEIAALAPTTPNLSYSLLPELIGSRFDLIVANASVWQFEPEALGSFLKQWWAASGTLMYNLPTEPLSDPQFRHLLRGQDLSDLCGARCELEISQYSYIGSSVEAIDFLTVPIFRSNANIALFSIFKKFTTDWTFVKARRT